MVPSVSRSVAVNSIGTLVPPVLAVATQPLLALGLGVEGRGELAAATAPLVLAVTILTFGVPDALVHYTARRIRGLGGLIARGLVTLGLAGILGSGAIAAIAPVLTGGHTVVTALIQIAGLGVAPALLVAGLRGIAAGRQSWHRVAIERILGSATLLVATVTMFAADALTPFSATIAVAGSMFVGGLVYAWPTRSGPLEDAREPTDGERVSVWGYGARVWLGALAGALLARLDQVLMTPLSDATQLGLYAVAASVSEVALVFNSSIREVVFSVESEAPDQRRLGLASRLSTLVTIGLAVAIAAVAPWAFPVLFGDGFAAAVPVLGVLLIAVVLGNPGSVAGAALSARGRPELRSAALTAAVVVNVALVVALVPTMGAFGAALATLAGTFLAGNLCILLLRLRFRVPAAQFYRFTPADVRTGWSLAVGILHRRDLSR